MLRSNIFNNKFFLVLTKYQKKMKRTILLALACASFSAFSFAQNTLHDPNVTPTITPKQIEALGNQHQQSDALIVLDFEGLGDNDNILEFYNGGTSQQGYSGTNYGIAFGSGSAIIDSDDGGSGNFANEPSPSTIMYFPDAQNAIMNVAAGFTTGFSFYYSTSAAATVSVYDGLNGTGNLLGNESLPINASGNSCTGDPTGSYCNWDDVGVSFSGTAKSVVFSGAANSVGFDDITFGSITPGGSPGQVPISDWAIYLGIFLILVFTVIRAKKLI